MKWFYYSHKVPPGKYPELTKEFLKAERDAGKTVSQIAEETKIPRGTISNHLTLHGLTNKRK